MVFSFDLFRLDKLKYIFSNWNKSSFSVKKFTVEYYIVYSRVYGIFTLCYYKVDGRSIKSLQFALRYEYKRDSKKDIKRRR